MISLIFYSVAIFIFLAYVLWVVKNWGVLPSISDSYYKYYKEGKMAPWLNVPMKYLFTFFIIGFSYFALMSNPTPLLFFAIGMLGITAVSPAFKDSKQIKLLHTIGAFGGITLSQLSIWIEHDMWYLTVGFIVLSGLILILSSFNKFNNKVWWIEILAFLSLFIAIYPH